jgi:CRISPR-associated protein (TIGR03984 family)
MQIHGLKLKTDFRSRATCEKSNVGSWQELNSLIAGFLTSGKVVAYLHYKVLIGKIEQGELAFYDKEKFEPKHLLQLRAFNEDKELYIRHQQGGSFAVRYRIDGEGELVEAVEACQVLWGKIKQDGSLTEGWVRLAEQRGVEMILPSEKVLLGETRVRLKTRNYIGYNDAKQAGYVDSRFVEFVAEEVL